MNNASDNRNITKKPHQVATSSEQPATTATATAATTTTPTTLMLTTMTRLTMTTNNHQIQNPSARTETRNKTINKLLQDQNHIIGNKQKAARDNQRASRNKQRTTSNNNNNNNNNDNKRGYPENDSFRETERITGNYPFVYCCDIRKYLVRIEQFSIERLNTKTKIIPLANHRGYRH